MTSLGLPTEGPSSLGGGMLGGLRHLNGVLKSGEKTKPGEVAKDSPLPPRKLTWNLKIIPLERKIIFKPYIFRFHVSFRGCVYRVRHTSQVILWEISEPSTVVPSPPDKKGKSSTQQCQLVGEMWSFPRGYPEKTSTKKGSWPIFCQYNRSLYFQPKRMHSHKGNPSKLVLIWSPKNV